MRPVAVFSPFGRIADDDGGERDGERFGLDPVMTSAVTEKPGRMRSGGWSSLTRTLKLIASEVVMRPWSSGSVLEIGEFSTCVTIPSKARFGYASIERIAFCPTWTLGTSVSSTISTASTVAMSEIVISCVPGLFIVPMTVTSPSLTGRFVTTPSIGARTVVLESVSREAFRFARFCSTRRRATWKSASAVSSADLARCWSASGRILAS